ncbi:MAG: hypothetical protein J4F28_07165 [Nitrosopumilaceae archaeon]|nr:hypothetical protein [Nitrosopumilaceae archaeon]
MIGVFIYEVNDEYVPADGEGNGPPGIDLTDVMPPEETIAAQPDVVNDDVEPQNETAVTPP